MLLAAKKNPVASFLASTKRFSHLLEQARSMPEQHRQQIAVDLFLQSKDLLDTQDADELKAVRHRAQDDRARLIYDGARDFTDARFAVATIIEQWAIARGELISPRFLTSGLLAQRRCTAIEKFIRDNLPEQLPEQY